MPAVLVLKGDQLKTIIIDADGPILDGKEKHAACYRKIAGELGFPPLEIETYWRLKRARTPLENILLLSGVSAQPADFQKLWMENIESSALLVLDRLQPRVPAKLQEWKGLGIRLMVSSLRQSFDKLVGQLESFGILPFFDRVSVSSAQGGGFGKSQALLSRMPEGLSGDLLWIGDTEADVEAARALPCPIWALSCGLRDEDFLMALRPDFFSRDIGEVEPEKAWSHP